MIDIQSTNRFLINHGMRKVMDIWRTLQIERQEHFSPSLKLYYVLAVHVQ